MILEDGLLPDAGVAAVEITPMELVLIVELRRCREAYVTVSEGEARAMFQERALPLVAAMIRGVTHTEIIETRTQPLAPSGLVSA